MTEREPDRDESTTDPILHIRDLKTHYPITKGVLRREIGRVRAVDGVSFSVDRGETLGIVGESGSGKTTAAMSILRLEEPTDGEIIFDGTSVTDLSAGALREFRRRAQLVVQDPNEAFNPRLTVGEAVSEPLALHGLDDVDRRRAIVEDILERVGLAAQDADRYPHEFSGGEKQRIAIARALVLNPDVIIADEPTSALDARVQADILGLLDRIRREFDIAVVFISHDIDVVRRFCDRVAVMYLGEIVERGPTESVLSDPRHPYTRVLVGSVPSLDPSDRELIEPLTDTVPDPADPPNGCRFHTRCPELIPPEEVSVSHDVWKAVASFRFTIQVGELPESIAPGTGAKELSPADIREAFSLPTPIPDESLEASVSSAVDAIASGDRQRAADLVADAAPTVCERETPGAYGERDVSCHRQNDATYAPPLAWEAIRRVGED